MSLLQEALAPRSDQLNGDDLISGPRTIKITGARFVVGDRGSKKVIINFEGDNGKPWHPCKTMGRAMVMVWGIVDSDDPDKISAQFIGKAVTIFRDPDVDFGAEKGIGGIRISHMSHITSPQSVKLTASQGKKRKFLFEPLQADVRQMPKQRQTAEQWAAEHMEAIAQATDADALDALCNRAARAMAKLADSHPDTHRALMNAADARRAELSVEGKPAEDMGESFTGFEGEGE